MSHELNEFYSSKKSNCSMVYFPAENMCCAFLSQNDKWYRGRILKVKNGQCEIFMTESGRKEIVHWSNVMHLDDKFIPLTEGVVKCRLKDIQPRKEDNYEFTQEAINKFKNLCLSSNLQICVFLFHAEDDIYDVVLCINQVSREICINAMLVNSKYCKSTGVESTREEVKMLVETNEVSKKVIVSNENYKSERSTSKIVRKKVKILNVLSPSEFYVIVESNIINFNKLHRDIQHEMMIAQNTDTIRRQTKYIVDDYCFCYVETTSYCDSQWFRARVNEDLNDNIYRVFLYDIGLFINCGIENMTVMFDKYRLFSGGAIRCNLTCVKPTGGEDKWSGYVKDEFKYYTEMYDEYAITLYGEKNQEMIFPVILWGAMDCVDPLAPKVFEYTNINKACVDKGICHLTESFSNIILDDSAHSQIALAEFEKYMQELDEALKKYNKETKIDGGDNEYEELLQQQVLSDVTTVIDHWLAPERITKTIFLGIPTYVDEHGIIYLHHVDSGTFIDQMKAVSYINNII